MANERIFQVRALTTNTVGVGGVQTLGFDAQPEEVLSSPDGGIGVEDLDVALLRVMATLSCTDVGQVNAILASTPGDTVFSAQQSGQPAKWSTYTVPGIVWTGFNMSLPRNPVADAVLNLSGQVRFADGTKDLDDIFVLDDTIEVEPTAIDPTRYFKPHTASFDPDGDDPAIAPVHVESISLGMAATVLSAGSDNDIGATAVDLAGWGPLEVSMTLQDAQEVASDKDIATSLVQAVRGVLTVTLKGRGGVDDGVLTINGLKFTGIAPAHGAGHSGYTVRGKATWRNGETKYKLNAVTKLFEIA